MAIAPRTTATTKTPTTCSCGSGLRPDRCCTLDWTQPSAPQGDIPNFTLAQTAFNNGKTAEAEQFAVDLLERFPLHLGALDLLYQIRRAQSRMIAAQILLARIVRIAPNNLLATQTLALLLFGNGAFAEAEHHARNAVRLSPTDPQSHKFDGHDHDRG